MTILFKMDKVETRTSVDVPFYLDSITETAKQSILNEIKSAYESAGCKVTFEFSLSEDQLSVHRLQYISAPSQEAFDAAFDAIRANAKITKKVSERNAYNKKNSIAFEQVETSLDPNNYPQYC